MTTLYMVVDQGQLHIGAGSDYVGSVPTYNYTLTGVGAWYLGRAKHVKVGDEEVYVDIDTLRALICSHGVGEAEAAELPTRDLTSYQLTVVVPLEGEKKYMVAHLSSEKKAQLNEQLFRAIWDKSKDEAVACALICSGAALDTPVWIREETGQLYFTPLFTDQLPAAEVPKSTFTHATPHLLAVKLSRMAIAKLLEEHGANLTFTGQTCSFSRSKQVTYAETAVFTDTYNGCFQLKYDGEKHQLKSNPLKKLVGSPAFTYVK